MHSVSNTKKKIITALMWGYPTGGRGKNIEKILEKIDELDHLLSSIKGKDLKKSEANKVYEAFGNIRGLGISTWSKLLYFFDVSIDSYKCQIYDMKIVDSLNKRQFSELGSQEWKQDNDHYYQYIKFLDEQAKSMDVKPDQIELFLFYYNLYYKFS